MGWVYLTSTFRTPSLEGPHTLFAWPAYLNIQGCSLEKGEQWNFHSNRVGEMTLGYSWIVFWRTKRNMSLGTREEPSYFSYTKSE